MFIVHRLVPLLTLTYHVTAHVCVGPIALRKDRKVSLVLQLYTRDVSKKRKEHFLRNENEEEVTVAS